ncbi:MAG TPA: hypothetical protein VEI97_12730, partial [bacterium]|nr:hypothetical protein [bacterium]
TKGYAVATNTAAPPSFGVTATPPNWRWIGAFLDGTFAYNDATGAPLTGEFSPIAGQVTGNFNWGGTAFTESFSRLDCSPGTLTNSHDFVAIIFADSANGTAENVTFDDIAWLVY